MNPRLLHAPGAQPLDPADWLVRDAVFAGQMAYRDRLIAERPGTVLALDPAGRAAAQELLEVVLAALDAGYGVGDLVLRPDGVALPVDRADPFATIGRLVQEDMLILDRDLGETEHRLMGGVLCFPSRWNLAQKMGRGLLGIHAPVSFYPESLARRVQRFFDAIRPGRPLWRANWLFYTDPELHVPTREHEKFDKGWDGPRLWLRSERQTLSRLPETGAVVFTIKTDISPADTLSREEVAGALAAVDALPPAEFDYKGGAPMRARLAALLEEAA
ncbi:DUF3445 domain-containing protein [Pontivivens ytuae]|uniref:DUF3445 domain-containing protein n=2 Tax=Pontivivens ytuae TaxID=2789856 RepID=A0A7S9LWG7_9RHOB|nr:DUF3445 domain-containing protein [Pontivivens ytuae]